MFTLTKFTQTDLTTLAKTKTKIVIIALYPFEKHFFGKEVIGIKGVTDVLVNLAASISQSRMDNIRSNENYFEDLVDEYNYYLQLHNQVQKIEGKIYTYRIVTSFQDIEANLTQETESKEIINIILSIEGGHSFNTGLVMAKNTANKNEVLKNVLAVKNWKHRPLFLTLAHHFYNELCGHACSISISLLKKNQNRGLNSGITELGYEVIELLLDNMEGKRILIDIKHMSTASRKAYYKFLDAKYAAENIPIIASHAACNGKHSIVQ